MDNTFLTLQKQSLKQLTLLCLILYIQGISHAQVYKEPDRTLEPNTNNSLIASSNTQSNEENLIYDEFEEKDLNPNNLSSLDQFNPQDTPTTLNLSISKGLEKVPLETVIATALQNNLDIKIAKSRVTRDKWRYYLAIGEHLPDAELSYSHSRFSGTTLVQGLIPVSINQTNIVPALTLSARLNGLGSIFNVFSEKHTYKASKSQEKQTIEEIIMQAVQDYNSLLKDKMEILVRDRSLDRAKAQLKLNELRLEAGVGTKFDVLRSQAQLAQEEQKLIAAYSELHSNSLKLNELMGYDLLTEIIPDETYVEQIHLFEGNMDAENMLDIAVKNRKDIERDKKTIQSLKNQMRGNLAGAVLPTVSVSGRFSGSGTHLNNIQSNQSVALEVSLPTGRDLGTQVVMNQRAITAEIQEAEYRLQKTISSVKKELLTAYYKIQSIKSIIEASEKEVEAAQESLKLAFLRLDAGVGTNNDLIDAQVQETSAKINHINAIVDYNTAQVELLFRLGTLSIDTAFNGYTPNSNS